MAIFRFYFQKDQLRTWQIVEHIPRFHICLFDYTRAVCYSTIDKLSDFMIGNCMWRSCRPVLPGRNSQKKKRLHSLYNTHWKRSFPFCYFDLLMYQKTSQRVCLCMFCNFDMKFCRRLSICVGCILKSVN